jgi:hypothetical protein
MKISDQKKMEKGISHKAQRKLSLVLTPQGAREAYSVEMSMKWWETQ